MSSENTVLNQTRRGWRVFETICGLLLYVAVVVSLGEIVGRIFFHITYDFVIDLSVWITVWAMLLIGGPLLAENGHVSIDFIRAKLWGKPRLVLELINTSATLLYGGAVTIGGALLVRQLYLRGSVFPRYFPIPKWFVELCVPIGMALFTLFAAWEFIKIIRRRSDDLPGGN